MRANQRSTSLDMHNIGQRYSTRETTCTARGCERIRICVEDSAAETLTSAWPGPHEGTDGSLLCPNRMASLNPKMDGIEATAGASQGSGSRISSYLLRSGFWTNLTTVADLDSNRQHASQSTRGARPPENKRTMAPTEYTIGWICALPIELEAAVSVMDANVSFADRPSNPTDSNIYAFGRIGQHNIVAACLPAGQLATGQAAAVAGQMAASFSSLRFGILRC